MSAKLDFKEIKLSFRPNQFLMCPAGVNDEEAHQISPEYQVSAADLTKAWAMVLETVPRLERVVWDEKARYFDLIQRTAFLRFPDRITTQIASMAKNRSTLAIYSRSTYGYSDLGVNKARIEAWIAALEGQLNQN